MYLWWDGDLTSMYIFHEHFLNYVGNVSLVKNIQNW